MLWLSGSSIFNSQNHRQQMVPYWLLTPPNGVFNAEAWSFYDAAAYAGPEYC
jgi:hypothetical protein